MFYQVYKIIDIFYWKTIKGIFYSNLLIYIVINTLIERKEVRKLSDRMYYTSTCEKPCLTECSTQYLWVALPVFLDLSLRTALTPTPLCLTFWGEFPDPPS